MSFVAIDDGLIALQTMIDESFKILWVFDTFNESLSQEILEVPQSLGIPDQPEPLFLEEIADTAQILLKSLIVEIAPHVKLPQVSNIPQHLQKLHILDELLIKLIGLLGIVWRGLGFLALNAIALLLELVLISLRHIIQMLNENKWGREGSGQLRQLRELDLEQIEKPKTLVILHYCGKRISVPLFQEVPNLAQLLYHHISKLEQAVLSNEPAWEKNSNAQIVCFQIKKDASSISAPERESDGDLRSDVLLSLLRIEGEPEDTPEELAFRVDVTKVYKYLEIQPFFRFFEDAPKHYPRAHQQFPYFQFHRVLAQSSISTTFLARRASNGHFYALKVYSNGARMGVQQLRTVEHLQRTDQARRDAELKCTLLVRSHLSALIPHPEMEQGESDDENSCKYIALASPFFPKGTLQDLLKDARYSRTRRVTEMECLNYLKELMWGAHLLHQKYNLIHRSIVPAHLQIDQNGQLRLTSYFSCLPCYGSDGHASYIHKGARRPTADPQQSFQQGQFQVGDYTAPEVIRGQSYNYLVDFFAIGVIVRKLYEVSQAHERVPVSQNNQNLMMTMINRLTSPDLRERQAIVTQIIEDIEHQNIEAAEQQIPMSNLLLQDIKVGRQIEQTHSKKFIQNQQSANGVDLQVITNYFRKPKAKTTLLRPNKKQKRTSKEKLSVKNSRERSEKGKEKSQKCFSKVSTDSQQDGQRRLSKKKTGSISKDSPASHSREKDGQKTITRQKESPAKKVSKSKSHQRRKKQQGTSSKLHIHQEEEHRLKATFAPILPKSPKSHLTSNKSAVFNRHK